MKKLILLSFASVFIFACTPKAGKKSTAADSVVPTVSPAPGTGAPNAPTDAHVIAAKTKFPDVTLDVLKKGHGIYYGACTRCHGAKNIISRDEKEWTDVLNDMAPKAALLPAEKDAVWKYIMAVKLAAK